STYGNRLHRSFEETVERLFAAIRDTVERGGKVLIPAFSLGRTQLIIHVIQQGLRDGRIPSIPVYVDSPLAAEVAEVYRAHPNSLSADIAQALKAALIDRERAQAEALAGTLRGLGSADGAAPAPGDRVVSG